MKLVSNMAKDMSSDSRYNAPAVVPAHYRQSMSATLFPC